MDFISVDFETPNRNNDTICAMGITLVCNSEIVFSHGVLINPQCDFDEMNTLIHGISSIDVEDAPTFDIVWSKYSGYFAHYAVVCHNASFDIAVLQKQASRLNISLPPLTIYCTLRICKHNYKFDSYKLENICKTLGIDYENDHDGASCSRAAANLMLHILNDTSVKLITFDATFSEKIKSTAPSNVQGACGLPLLDYYDGNITFEGSRFLVTGEIPALSRADVKREIESRGGLFVSGISKKVTYLVIGLLDENIVKRGDLKSSKITTAEALNANNGADIKLINYMRFKEVLA